MTHAEKALESVHNGMVVGLGTGRAAADFLWALAKRVQAGLRIRGVPTSEKSASLARELGIPLASLDDVHAQIDLCVDGADEFDPQLNLIKGLGGALVREKIVAAASRKFLVLVGPDNFDVKRARSHLGERGVLPIEVVPFGLPLVRRCLNEMGLSADVRQANGAPVVSDNGNLLLDCRITPLPDPRSFETCLTSIPGVVDTGLFLGMADAVLVQDGERLEVLEAGNLTVEI